MPRLISQDEYLSKLAALQSSDVLGRQMAQEQAVTQMAKLAGAILAQGGELPEMEKIAAGMEKVAWEMVETGELTPEQFQFLKEAGIFGRIGKWIAGGGMKRGVRAMRTRAAGGLQRVGATRMAQRVAPPKISGRARAEARRQAKPGWLERRRARREVERGIERGPQVPKDQPIQVGQPRTAVPAGAQQTGPYRAQGRVKTKSEIKQERKRAHQAELERRRQAAEAPQTQQAQQPTTATARSKEMADQAQQQGWWQRLTGRGQPKKAPGWGRLALYGGAGLGAYGLYKGLGWGARQLEQASTTPWAYGGGWSPVPYGYGHTPYGPGMPTMGPGA